jgi:hypothetical protein
LDACDNAGTRIAINAACVRRGMPWIYGGIFRTEGLAMAILPGKGPCLRTHRRAYCRRRLQLSGRSRRLLRSGFCWALRMHGDSCSGSIYGACASRRCGFHGGTRAACVVERLPWHDFAIRERARRLNVALIPTNGCNPSGSVAALCSRR